jgi:hypothetical protein
MPDVLLERWAVERIEMPGVCIACNEDAPPEPPTTWRRRPLWATLLGLVFSRLLVAGFTTHVMDAALPRCRRHREVFSYRRLARVGALGVFVPMFLLMSYTPLGKAGAVPEFLSWLVFGAAVALWFAADLWARRTFTGIRRIDDYGLYLQSASPRFVAAWEEAKSRLERPHE